MKYNDLTTREKNEMAIYFGFNGANPYRTFDRWIKDDNKGKMRLLSLMINDFLKKKTIKKEKTMKIVLILTVEKVTKDYCHQNLQTS